MPVVIIVAGKVLTRFVIDTDGTVVFVEIAQSTLANESVESCIAWAIGRLPFEPGNGIAEITYPWILKHGGHKGCERDPSINAIGS